MEDVDNQVMPTVSSEKNQLECNPDTPVVGDKQYEIQPGHGDGTQETVGMSQSVGDTTYL
jgi:hypothetical protein